VFSGGPPYHLLWSSVFDSEKKTAGRPADWKRIAGLFKRYDEGAELSPVAIREGGKRSGGRVVVEGESGGAPPW